MTTLLAIGDMHLGRPPAALPEDLRHRQRQLGPETAWMMAVAEAVDRKVDGVLLAGDLVERSRDFFVAYGQLKSGIEKLTEAGIPVMAVAGNHDTHVLPRLADEIDELHLIGRDGQWEEVQLDGLTVLGWSFPQPQVRRSPLDTLKAQRSGQTVIGLLHCDRDQSESSHAPVTSDALEKAPADAWLLGHIHQPDALDGKRPIGYLGSITALRASETGARGPWLIQISKGAIAAEHLPLAPLRYESLTIDCSDLEDAERLSERILDACRKTVTALNDLDHQPEALGLRLILTGQTRVASALEQVAEDLLKDGRSWEESGISCFIQKIELATSPAIDLQRLARQSDPCGLLARRLIALEDPDSEEFRRLMELGHQQLDPVAKSREFRDLGRKLDDTEVARWMRQAGLSALTRLIQQREAIK